MRLNTPTEPPPVLWEESLLDSRLEAQLTQSIDQARLGNLPRDLPTVPPTEPTPIRSQIYDSTYSQLIAGCGIAAIDGYLATRDYAAAKGLHLVEMKHNGVDLQDLISTLVIHSQKLAEMESRQPAARYKR